jgi:hypothetical protein
MALDLSFPRRPVLEMYLAGAWRNISTDLRQKPAVVITRPRRDWAVKPSPGLCRLTLDDTSHNYSQHDPMGIYHGFEFLNAPGRFALEVGKDAFPRTVAANSWGASPQNGAWISLVSGTAGMSVSGNEGRHTVTTTNSYAMTTLDTITVRDLEQRVSVTIDSVASVTGGVLEPANMVMGRPDPRAA